MLMIAQDQNWDLHEKSVPHPPAPSWITTLAFKLEYLKESNDILAYLPSFCDGYDCTRSFMDHAPRGSCDSGVRKVAKNMKMTNCTSAPEHISQASRSLRYIKIRLHAWRI